MVTRKEKREMEKSDNYFFEFVKIQHHFFKDLKKKLKKVEDPLHQSYISYDTDVILMMLILKNACNLKSMRGMTNRLNKDECIKNLSTFLGDIKLEELPHYDTINNFLIRLNPEELGEIRTYMIKELLQKRCFDRYRINGKYWGVIIDGTGLFTFRKKHYEHFLRRVYTDEETGEKKTIYMHHVLEAKLVVGDMVLSIDSEFIENESEDVPKQDCELNAFYRLTDRIKDTFKRLPICILGDSLYACESVFKQCDRHKWKYLFRFKEGRIKSIMNEFEELKEIEPSGVKDTYWVNEFSYNERHVNILEGIIETKERQKHYTFITNITITKKNARKLVSAGRSRWKIENEGFNKQKNIRYYIEHAASQDYTAMKNHYILTQITDIIVQLFENGSNMLRNMKNTAKEISSNLLESIRTRLLTTEDIIKAVKPIQVRFT
jgi:hypothetical protein